MATVRATDEQRLAFGRVAELYDRARPSYPAAVVDELVEQGGLRAGDRVLEVGAGTGKLTCLLAARRLGHAGASLCARGRRTQAWRHASRDLDAPRLGGHAAARSVARRIYRIAAPELQADFPMHPGSEPTDMAGDWQAEIEASEGFVEPQVHMYPWGATYSTTEYLELLQTHQDHILLESVARERLLAAVAAAIDDAGGEIVLSFVTRLCLARRG
jgi:hypothetical protein